MIRTLDVEPVGCDPTTLKLQLSIKYGFVNNTSKSVSVIRRDGSIDTIPPIYSSRGDRGTFEIMYSVDAAPSIINTQHDLSHMSASERRIFNELKNKGIQKGNTRALKYVVQAADLIDTEGAFISALDIVLSMRDIGKLPKHPSSASSLLETFGDSALKDVYTFRLALVNKFNMVGDLFVKVCGVTTKVPRIESATVPDGIYVSYGIGENTQLRHYSFTDEEMPLDLYTSRREAEIYGGELSAAIEKLSKEKDEYRDKMNSWKRERAELLDSHESALHRAEVNKQILNHTIVEQEKLLDSVRREREHEVKLIETETKSRADEQSTVRKNGVEWLKFVPHILGTVSLAGALLT